MIKIIRSITEGVDGCNKAGGIGYNAANAPSIVRVSCNGLSVLINDSDYVALQILDEVVGNSVVKNTANAVLVVIEGNKSISIPSFAEDLGTVESIAHVGMLKLYYIPG